MTSLAFILGVLPLMVSKGAGAGAQNALGTAVVGGMVSGTVLAIFFVPLFYVVVQGLFGRAKAPAVTPSEGGTSTSTSTGTGNGTDTPTTPLLNEGH